MKQTAPYNEKELLMAVASGDERAFAELFRNYHPFLAEHLLRLTKSSVIMEEIVQDTFLKVWIGRKNLPAVDNFTGYLLVASRNEALKALDKLNKEFRSKTEFMETMYSEVAEDETAIMRAVLIDEAVDTLPPRQKEVFLLHRHQRLTYLEIAERLGISRETVKTHLEKAVKTIKDHVQKKLGLFVLLFQLLKN